MVDLDLTAPDSHPRPSSFDAEVERLVHDRFASRLGDHDPGLWGPDAESEARIRLAWTSLHETSRQLIAPIGKLRDEFMSHGMDHVVLCGMGGSSLAPEVICAAAGVELTVLDSSDPDQVRSAIGDRLATSIVVVSSKSGGTVETDSQKRAYEHAFTTAGHDPADHLVIVTDPGSPLDRSARESGYRVFNADPEVGGRYSALTAFGLVPSGLAGAPISQLLDEAAAAAAGLSADETSNTGLRLGAFLGTAATSGVDKLVIADTTGDGLGNWIEQLIAESTGKDGKGILPVVVAGTDAPNFAPSTTDSALLTIGAPITDPASSGFAASVTAPLGAQLLLWQWATAVAGRVIGINPFDQPDVELAKKAARGLLEGDGVQPAAAFVDDTIAVFASDGLLPAGTSTVDAAIEALLSQLDPDTGYVSLQAYVSRADHPDLDSIRDAVASRTGRPTTVGWGPRFLHSTGQYHKGGPPNGVFVQITSSPTADLAIEGLTFTFGEFRDAQAIGDARVLADHGRPVLRLAAATPGDFDRIAQALS